MEKTLKRSIISILILAFSLTAAFAGYNWYGFSAGAEFGFNQTDLGVDKLSVGGSTVGIPLTLEGRNYFGKEGTWGLGYAFGVYIPISSEQGDYGLSNLAVSIRPELTLRYHKQFNKTLSLEAGLGYMFEWRQTRVQAGGESYGKVTTMSHTLTMDAEFGFNFNNVITILVGGRIYTPLYIDKQIEKGRFQSSSGHYNQIGIYLAPQITVCKTY